MKKLFAFTLLTAFANLASATDSVELATSKPVQLAIDELPSVSSGDSPSRKGKAGRAAGYARVIQLNGDVPSYFVRSYLQEEPIASAIPVILPEGWRLQVREDAHPIKTLTASKGEHWLDVLDRGAQAEEVSLAVDVKRKVVQIVPAPKRFLPNVMPISAQTTVVTHGITLPGHYTSGLVFHRVAELYGYTIQLNGFTSSILAPVTISGESIIDDLRVALAAMPTDVHYKIQVDAAEQLISVSQSDVNQLVVKFAAKELAPPVATSGCWFPWFSKIEKQDTPKQVVSLYEVLPLTVQQRVKPESSPVNFYLKPDSPSLKAAMADWSQQNGYHMVWQATADFRITEEFAYSGTFEDMLKAVERRTQTSKVPLAIVYDGHNIVVSDKFNATPVAKEVWLTKK